MSTEFTADEVLSAMDEAIFALEFLPGGDGILAKERLQKVRSAYADTLSKPADSGRVGDDVRGLLAYVYGMGASHGHHYTVEGGYTAYTHNEWRDAYREAIDTAIDEDAETFAALAAQGQGEAVAEIWPSKYHNKRLTAIISLANGYDYETRSIAAAWLAERTAPPASHAGVPEGMVLVPREPTDEMCTAAMAGSKSRKVILPDGSELLRDPYYFAYKDMIAAAPSAPEGDGGGE